jgi:hypothetical protein
MEELGRLNFCCFLILLCIGCAQVVAPTGGPKDTKPPKPLLYEPYNKSTHFASKKIYVTFNKYIQIKDLQSQLVVSPPLKHFPVAIVKKNKILEVQIKDTLLDSTTYTFNFGNAIMDINEGTILPNFHYVFSTGSYLDSLVLKGNAKDAFTRDPIKEGLVMLFANLDDSAPYKVLPSYCGRTDANGNYKIENIKNGTYRLIILSKSQNGYEYHPYSEEIGFTSKPLHLEENDSANVFLFIEEDTHLHFVTARAIERGKIMLVFSAPADSISILPLNLQETQNPPYTYIQYYGAKHDTVYYWINTPGLDSLHFIISKNGTNIDTDQVYSIPKVVIKKNAKPPSLKITSNIISNQQDYDYHSPITIKSDHPVMKINWSRFYLTSGKDTIKFKVDTTGLPFQLSLQTNLISDSTYKLFLTPGAMTDIFGLTNDTLIQRFKVVEPTYFGSLNVDLHFSKQSHYIVQLLDTKGKTYKENKVEGSQKVGYDALPPGDYRIRVIKDDDGNGKWTTGNYLKKRQPERVYYYPQVITIRSNWDLTQEWTVN